MRIASTILFAALLSACASAPAQRRLAAVDGDCGASAREILEKVVRTNDFTVWRDLGEYVQMLGDGFRRALQDLRDGQQWTDMGAGEGRALKDFFAEARAQGRSPRAALVSFEVTDADFPADPSFRVLKGRFVEDIPDAELGTSRVLSDNYGPLAYSGQPGKVMETYMRVLEEEGELFWAAGSLEYMDWGLRSDMRSFVEEGGEQVPLHLWMKKHLLAAGYQVSEEKHIYVQPTHGRRREPQEVEIQLLRIKKPAGARPLRLPQLRLLESVDERRPPARRFSVVD